MDRKLHLLETFFAQDDQGTPYKICGYEHMVALPLVSNGAEPQWEPTGIAEYRLATGEHVDMEPDGSYRVAANSLHLHRA